MADRFANFTMLDGPIPGMSLTTTPGDRPWENPPSLVTVEDAIEFYVDRILGNEDSHEGILEAIEAGVPIRNFASMLNKAAVMEGRHTLDVGYLVMPVIEELVMAVCDMYDVEYVQSIDDVIKENYASPRAIRMAMQDIQKSKMEEVDKEAMMMNEEKSMPSTVAKGLMARPQKEEE